MADGLIESGGVVLGDSRFHVGDRVIARTQNRQLRPTDGSTTAYVRNGTKGVIAAIGEGPEPDLVVDFDDRGPIRVPHEWLTADIRHGVRGGLTPAYAMTTHAAQGDTFDAARSLLTDRSSTEGQNVALTRGENDFRVYAVDATQLEPPAAEHHLPIINNERALTERIEHQLTKPKPTDLATVADTAIAEVLSLREQTLEELHKINTPAARRATQLAEDQAFTKVKANPPSTLVSLIGDRPAKDSTAWDQAARQFAAYDVRWGAALTPDEAVPLPPTNNPRQRRDYDQLIDAVVDARAEKYRNIPVRQLAASRRTLVASIDNNTNSDPRTLSSAITKLTCEIGSHVGAESPLLVRQLADLRNEYKRHPAVATSQQRRRIELAAIDQIVEEHVDQALETPQPYRTAAMPSDHPDPELAHRTIEKYRISWLGIEPGAGSVQDVGSPLSLAVGNRPVSPAMRRSWDRVASTTHRQGQGHGLGRS